MAADPRLVPYFDLPFQHASARILKSMNRRGDSARYLELLGRIREALPDAAIRSTFLVGFPGESEEDFAELLDFQAKADLDWVGSFAYSREEGTAAYRMPARVPKKTVAARRRALEEAQGPITRERLGRFVGREIDVLVEEQVARASDGDEELSLGRSMEPGSRRRRAHRHPRRAPAGLGRSRARVLAVKGVDFDALPARTSPRGRTRRPRRAPMSEPAPLSVDRSTPSSSPPCATREAASSSSPAPARARRG